MTLANAKELFNQAFEDELSAMLDKGHDLSEFRVGGKKRPTKKDPEPTGEDRQWWLEHGPGMVEAWIRWRQKSGWHVWTTPDGKPAIELELEVEIAGRPFRAIIDRVMILPNAGSLVIVDLKTGARSPESDLQLGVYRHALHLLYPQVHVNFGGYWMARKGDLETVSLIRYDPTMIEAWYERYHQAVAGGIFLPHVTTMCRACGHRKFCAVFGGSESHLDPDSPHYQGEENVGTN